MRPSVDTTREPSPVSAACGGVSPLYLAGAGGLSGRRRIGRQQAMHYPTTRPGDQTDDYHGTQIADPYRWLEELDSAETRAWVEAQNKVHLRLSGADPQPRAIRQRLTQLWNYERYGVPHERGGRYFYTPQRRPAEPERAVRRRHARRPSRACLLDPNHAVERRHRRPGRTGRQRRRQAHGVRPGRSRQRLAGMARARRARPATTADRPAQVGQVFRRGVDARRTRASTTAATTSRPRRRASSPERTTIQKLYYHKLGDPQADDSWSTSGRTRRNGASAAT